VLEEEKVVAGNRGSQAMRPIPKSDPSPSEYKMTGWSSRKDTILCGTVSSSRNDKGGRHSWVSGGGGVCLPAVNYAFRVSSPADARCLCQSVRVRQIRTKSWE
jgi:hypothetical protein